MSSTSNGTSTNGTDNGTSTNVINAGDLFTAAGQLDAFLKLATLLEKVWYHNELPPIGHTRIDLARVLRFLAERLRAADHWPGYDDQLRSSMLGDVESIATGYYDAIITNSSLGPDATDIGPPRTVDTVTAGTSSSWPSYDVSDIAPSTSTSESTRWPRRRYQRQRDLHLNDPTLPPWLREAVDAAMVKIREARKAWSSASTWKNRRGRFRRVLQREIDQRAREQCDLELTAWGTVQVRMPQELVVSVFLPAAWESSYRTITEQGHFPEYRTAARKGREFRITAYIRKALSVDVSQWAARSFTKLIPMQRRSCGLTGQLPPPIVVELPLSIVGELSLRTIVVAGRRRGGARLRRVYAPRTPRRPS